jgi:hypothetical protein
MWSSGEVVRRREVLNDGRCWLDVPVFVVQDDDVLVTYIARGAAFIFPPGRWPGTTGWHPWHGKTSWEGNGTLMLQRSGEAYAIWVFWFGTERAFHGWYVNFQEPFRRTSDGYETQDLELDIWVPSTGGWEWKDAELLEQRIAEGRFTSEQVAATWEEGHRVAALLDAQEHWWPDEWATWSPPPGWDAPWPLEARAQPN